MAEADSSSKGRHEEKEDPNRDLKRDYAKHERLMRERNRDPTRDESYRLHPRKSFSPFKPYEKEGDSEYINSRNKGLPRFSPKRLFTPDLVDKPEIRSRDFTKDYNFLEKMYIDSFGLEQEMIGVRNVKARGIMNGVGDILSSSFDILKSPLLEDPKIKLKFLKEDGKYITDMRSYR